MNTQPVIQGLAIQDPEGELSLGLLDADNNETALVLVRDRERGSTVTLFGTGFKAVGEIRLAKLDGTDVNGTDPVRIPLPSPGVTVSDAQISFDTRLISFSNPASADANKTSDWRRIMLLSARDTTISGQDRRFYAGPMPVYNGLDGLTVGSLHYRHDGDTMTFKGENLSMVSSVEIVDMTGQLIPGMKPLGRSSINILSETRFSISPNAFANTHSGDSVTMDRRVRINTPFGSTTSTPADRFSFSATPVFERFGGPGFDTVANTYSAADGALHIFGKNFRGMKNLKFEDNASGIFLDIDLDPKSPPNGSPHQSRRHPDRDRFQVLRHPR